VVKRWLSPLSARQQYLTANTDKEEKLDGLLALNFQTFKKVQVLAV
jgi:hypothetical protein